MESTINGRPAEDYLSPSQVAFQVNKARETISRLAAKGDIPGAVLVRGEWLIPVESLSAASLQRSVGRPKKKT